MTLKEHRKHLAKLAKVEAEALDNLTAAEMAFEEAYEIYMLARDAKRNIGKECLQAIDDIKEGKGHRFVVRKKAKK
jgi:hypothetical protein